ncbi:MAG: prolyl oligopeptidase family serine peptidase, partial [Planctomycetota bacterium]
MSPSLPADDPSLSPDDSTLPSDDPYLWLEDVTGDKALDWVRQRNDKTMQTIGGDPDFRKLREDLRTILDSDARIPAVTKRGDYFYNFWRDQEHPRGLWRRTTPEEYRKENPDWDIILDLDAIATAEDENWVWDGASLLRPDYDLALVNLSRGGADASVTREFDLKTRQFVEGGFSREEAKGSMGWIDRDTVFVQTDFGEGSMTESGYPRLTKVWKRGTPMDSAEIVFEGRPDDMMVGGYHDDTPGFERNFVRRSVAFYNDELFLLRNEDGKFSPVQIDIPNSANKSVVREHLLIEPRDPWTVGGKTFPAGCLLVTSFDEYMDGKRDFDVLFEPSETTALSGWGVTKDYVFINVLDDVKNRIRVLRESDGQWVSEPLVGAPEFGRVGIRAVDADESNEYFMTSTNYLTPTTLLLGEIGKEPEVIKSLPSFFDAEGLEITQHFATSKDGTRVPYFMVAKKDLKPNHSNPTLLYGYGGFEISLLPSYSATVGRSWLEAGGVYVVANIRGGGEYGPRWHQAALKKNRLRAYEDFASVAEDLTGRGITDREHLGIQGGSNGGLLVGNMVTLYPELFSAAVCQVPLLDMKRYHKLLAGASWMAEYGDPDIPA